MKKFIKKIVFLFIPIFLILLIIESLLRFIPNDYSYKKAHFYTKKCKAETIILGNSYTLYGLNPTYFNAPTINLAHVSQSLNIDLLLLNKYLKNKQKPKNIILPLNCLSLHARLEKDTEKWRMKDYVLYYGFKANNFKNYFEILSVPFRENISALYRFYVKNKSKTNLISNGFSLKYNSFFDSNDHVKIKQTLQYHKTNAKNKLMNLGDLNKIISICEKKKIKIIFVYMPTTIIYTNQMAPEILKLKKIVRKISKLHKIKFIDFSTTIYKNSYFYDLDHLNVFGAKLISTQLNDSIKK